MKIITIAISVLLAGSVAVANNAQTPKKAGTTLEKLVRTCKNLARNPQLKSFTSEVFCSGSKTIWKESAPKMVTEATDFFVTSEITMKGNRYKVDPQNAVFAGEGSATKCFSYTEYEIPYQNVSVVLDSCQKLEEILVEGRANYCARLLTSKGTLTNKEIPTGNKFNTCK